jgi:DNA-binding response OmpR family regulator
MTRIEESLDKSTPLQTSFPGARILIVDDEDPLRRTLTDLLTRVGYQAWAVGSGTDALESMAQREYDVVLLDLKMPDIDGTDVLREARNYTSETIFIIMTAYATLDSALVGIRHGAFDYLLKPSSLQTIVKTIESGLLERRHRYQQKTQDPITLLEQALAALRSEPVPVSEKDGEESRFLKAPNILMDVQKRVVLLHGDHVDLTPTEFDILAYLMRHRQRVVSPVELVEHLRGYELPKREASDFLRSHIHRLRVKMEPEDSEEYRYIRTIRGKGFTFRNERTS